MKLIITERQLRGHLKSSLKKEEDDPNDPSFKQHITKLIQSGDPNNIELAMQLAKGQKIDISGQIQHLLDLWAFAKAGGMPHQIPAALTASGRGSGGHTGPTDIEKIRELFTITDIVLFGNSRVTEIPKNIHLLRNLDKLVLSGVQNVTLIPSAVGNIPNLRTLNLGAVGATKLPKTLGNLKRLERLIIDKTKIRTLPKSITTLPNLKMLWFRNNEMTVLPRRIGDLQSLTSLNLTGNKITQLPKSIKKLTNLKFITLKGNPIPSEVIEELRATLPNTKINF